jgi:hypothetical protein
MALLCVVHPVITCCAPASVASQLIKGQQACLLLHGVGEKATVYEMAAVRLQCAATHLAVRPACRCPFTHAEAQPAFNHTMQSATKRVADKWRYASISMP